MEQLTGCSIEVMNPTSMKVFSEVEALASMEVAAVESRKYLP